MDRETKVRDKKTENEIDLPEGWKRVKLGEIAENRKFAIVDGPFGTQLHSNEYVEGGEIPVIRVINLSFEGKFIDENLVFITKKKAKFLERSKVCPGDIILAKTGATIGKSGIFPRKYSEGIIASSCLKISIDNSKASEKFLLYFLVSQRGQKIILDNAIGTTRTT
ncbi:MAG TPA: restriction endonuclease subunit S, partial [Candidatus Atribacteria bacterium]|nr:restriction endonuclease subunit S [Candidatus Atribacteria bacterium]